MTDYRNRITGLEYVASKDLTPHPGNWREHGKAQTEALRGVLAEVGIAGALLAYRSERNGGALTVIDGHLRKDAAPQKWPVLVLDVDDGEADYLLATHDPLAAMAQSDAAALDSLLRNVSTDSAAVQSMLAELAEGAGLYPDKPAVQDVEPQIDRAEELRQKWGVEAGDLWELGAHRLICGDCTDPATVARVMGGERAAMCFTSPPYNGHTELNTHRIVDGKRVYKSHDLYLDNDADNKTPEEYLAFNALVFAAIGLAVESDGNIFYNLSYNANSRSEYIRIIADALDAGFCLHETIVWRKRGMPNPAINVLTRDYEFVFLLNRAETYRTNKRYAEPSSNVWEIANAGAQNELHHACFPVALPARALADTTAGGDIIFEPFSGSGTTLIACEQLGRKCRGIEISPAYVAVTLERWATMTGKTPELLP